VFSGKPDSLSHVTQLKAIKKIVSDKSINGKNIKFLGNQDLDIG
jgi:hypothetical protein